MTPNLNSSKDAAQRLLEDALKHLLHCELSQIPVSFDSLAGALSLSRSESIDLCSQLIQLGWVAWTHDQHELTPTGRSLATQLVRGHRIYETWLAHHTSTLPSHWHQHADLAEHFLSEDAVNAMANALNNPRFDPHGDPIPTREGLLPTLPRTALQSWSSPHPAIIEHIEDEPRSLYEPIYRHALCPGSVLNEVKLLPDGSVSFVTENLPIHLPAKLAALIQVSALPTDFSIPPDLSRLSALPVGSSATIHQLSPSCIGAERSRLLDLGVVPGTRIHCEFTSPFGSPRSYLIRGAMIALRDYQADRIRIHSIVHPT